MKPLHWTTFQQKSLYNVKVCVQNSFIYKFYNNCNRDSVFPDPMKRADTTPAHKKDEKQTNKITDPLVF